MAAKRSREDDLGLASDSSSQAGGNKKRKNAGDANLPDALSKLEQDMSSRDSMSFEVGAVEDNLEETIPALESNGGESADSDASEPGQDDIM